MVGRLKSELSQAQDTIAKLQAIALVGLDGVVGGIQFWLWTFFSILWICEGCTFFGASWGLSGLSV